MPPTSKKAEAFWVATIAESQTAHPPLKGDLEVAVAVVGAGIVGLSAALLLQRGGRRVAVVEALQVGRQVTGRSTAKITSQHGLIYQALEKSFGEKGAQAYGAANEAGLIRSCASLRSSASTATWSASPHTSTAVLANS
jgi:glycine/D-amino acid oxidase-like deaminating enzyme